jgi:mono/diheme cytochrome c family protein
VSTSAPAGRALAQATCQGCHSVERYGRSSNSNAPAFPVIVNQEGVTAQTLSTWLKGAHNYPREMDFHVGLTEVDKLVEYMLTLREPNYKRPPD